MKVASVIKMKTDVPFIRKGEHICVDEEGNTYRTIRDDFFITPMHIEDVNDPLHKWLFEVLS